jgi:hypothetical protein
LRTRILGPLTPSLHLMGFAFAIEDVSRFSAAFVFASMWLTAAADVGANLIATGNLLFGNNIDSCFLDFRHF